MKRTLARIRGQGKTWHDISAAPVPRRVVRALGVSPTDTEYLLPIAFDPAVFDPDESMMRTLARIRANGLTDPWCGPPGSAFPDGRACGRNTG